MSDGKKAMYEDEDEWASFVNEYKLYNLAKLSPYSLEAEFAKEGIKKFKLRPNYVIEYVKLKKELHDLLATSVAEAEEYKEFLRLKEKFKE